MGRKRDDFSWLVTIWEERKRDDGQRPSAPRYERQAPEYSQWKRRQKRNMWTFIIYAIMIALFIIIPFLLG